MNYEKPTLPPILGDIDYLAEIRQILKRKEYCYSAGKSHSKKQHSKKTRKRRKKNKVAAKQRKINRK